jgi:lysophospholipase L1-like esterase
LFYILNLGCIKDRIANPTGPITAMDWDTTFIVDQVNFPDSNAINRSVIIKGSQSRFTAFFNKILSGQEVFIGHIGGSITAGAGASSQDKCFANLLAQFLRTMFVNAHINVINAGIGLTNTRFGCSRIQEDLLDKKPDIVIAEFAVNDNPFDTFTTTAAMEGIVRQCLRKADLPVILFNTFNSIGDSANQELFKRVSERYNVPMISYRNAIWPLIQENKIQWASLVADAIHPNNTGHFLCGYLLYRFLKNSYASIDTSAAQSETLSEYCMTDLYENANIYHSSDSMIKERGNCWQKEIRELGRVKYFSQRQSDSIKFETDVQELVIGFHYAKNMDSKIQITVNGESIDTLSNFWENGNDYGFLGLYRIFLTKSPSQQNVSIRHLDDNMFLIEYMLYASMSSFTGLIEANPINKLNF